MEYDCLSQAFVFISLVTTLDLRHRCFDSKSRDLASRTAVLCKGISFSGCLEGGRAESYLH